MVVEKIWGTLGSKGKSSGDENKMGWDEKLYFDPFAFVLKLFCIQTLHSPEKLHHLLLCSLIKLVRECKHFVKMLKIWRWKKYEIEGKIIFQCFCISWQIIMPPWETFLSLAKLLHSPRNFALNGKSLGYHKNLLWENAKGGGNNMKNYISVLLHLPTNIHVALRNIFECTQKICEQVLNYNFPYYL